LSNWKLRMAHCQTIDPALSPSGDLFRQTGSDIQKVNDDGDT
jgi:hypothetical protein